MIIGITGSYASGKSTVAKLLKEAGYYEIDVDKIGHTALESKKEQIINKFGKVIIDENGEIDRKKLGNIVFNDNKKLEELNKIVHPFMIDQVLKELKSVEKEKIIINAALLYEMQLNTLCDKIIVVKTDEEILLKRAMKRDNRSEAQIRKILENQITYNENNLMADYISKNNGDISILRDILQNIIKREKW